MSAGGGAFYMAAKPAATELATIREACRSARLASPQPGELTPPSLWLPDLGRFSRRRRAGRNDRRRLNQPPHKGIDKPGAI